MAINKVVFGNEIQMDLTEDTVTEDKVLEGETFHDRSGNSRVGSLVIPVQDVEVNGESVVDEEGIAEVVVPVSGDVSTTDSFESYTGGKVKSVQMELKPIQDLHGFDYPWAGGAGKNKLPKIETTTISGITFNSDDFGIVRANGTASAVITLTKQFTLPSGQYYFSGCADGGNMQDTYDVYIWNNTDNERAKQFNGTSSVISLVNSTQSGELLIDSSKSYSFIIRIRQNYVANDVVFKPMIRLSTETDPTFEPYENKCPISAHTQAKLEQRGKNLLPNIIETRSTHSFWVGQSSGSTYPFHFEKDKTYVISFDSNYSTSSMYYVESGGTDTEIGRSGSTFTPSKDMDVDLWIYGGGLSEVSNVQIELGSSATAYEPYQGKDYIINLGGSYYWLRGDIVSGKWYVVGQGVTYDGSSDEEWYKISGENRYYTPKPADVSAHLEGTISNNFKFYGNQAAGVPDGQFYIGASNLGVRLESITAVADWKTFISNNPLTIIYPLATPIPLDLTPQQILAIIGENNFSAPLNQQEIIEIVARNIAEFNEVIDDENVSDEFTYSSEKIEDRLDEYVDKDAVEEKSATDEFTTINGGLLSSLKVALSPNQDLHGYSEPWVGGSKKNKAPLVDKAGYGLTFVADELLGKMTMTGLATGDGWGAGIMVQINLPVGSYICSATNNPNNAQVLINYNPQGVVTSSGVTINVTDATQNIRVAWLIASGTTYNNVIEGLMIRSASESDPTFEPYENICPISGHTQVEVGDDGKNKCEGMIYDGKVPSISNGVLVPFHGTHSDFIEVKPNTEYTASFGYDVFNVICEYTSNKRFIKASSGSVVTITTDATTAYVMLRSDLPNDTDSPSWAQLELGSTATAYVPYNGYQVTVNLGGTYYSGTLDVVSGVFTPDTAEVDLGSLTWTYEASWGASSDFYAIINNALNIKRPDTRDDVANAICTQYKMVSRNEFYDSADSNIAILPTPYIKIRDSRYNDGTAFQSAMNGVMLVYELANPTSIQLSPTMVKALVGENHLSAPLEGQEITESKYRELFTWDEVEEIAQKIADSKIDNLNTAYDTTFSSAFTEARYVKKIYEAPALTALQIVLSGASSVTFNHQLIFSNTQTCCELIQFGSGARIGITDVAISQGSVTFTFDSPLTKAIGFRCRITNDFVS